MRQLDRLDPLPADWTERQAVQLARITAELRQAAASLERGGAEGRARTTGGDGARIVIIGLAEARTLLRAIEPHTLSIGGRRRHTARLIAALGQWWRSFSRLSLTPPAAMLPAAIHAGIEVRDTLDSWLRAMQWHQATTAAKKSWPSVHNRASAAIDGASVLAMFSDNQEMVAQPCPKPKKSRRRPPAPIRAQRPLLLPIPGRASVAADDAAPPLPAMPRRSAA